MNRPLLITAGVVIILFVVGVWVYLLAFGTPQQTSEVFTNLGVLSPTEENTQIIDTTPAVEAPVTLALGGSQLQQLTTRAIAGFAFVGTSTNLIRYVERGTGYIYEIDLNRGTERQTSLITIPQASQAVFSPNATLVAVTSFGDTDIKTTVLPAVSDTSPSPTLIAVPNKAENIIFENEQTLYFTLEQEGRTKGYAYNLKTLAQSELFTLPIAGLTMHWGQKVAGIFAQTKPSVNLEGYLYELTGNTLVPVTEGAHGLIAQIGEADTIVSAINEGAYVSYSVSNGEELNQALFMVPEKCAFGAATEAVVWCAAPATVTNTSYLEDWYKGVISSEDYLWVVDLDDQTSTLEGDIPNLAGRAVDVTNLAINTSANLLAFINKQDGALWLYRITQ